MKILVTGKNGQLGKSIHEIVANNKQINEFVFVGRDKLDFSQNDNITILQNILKIITLMLLSIVPHIRQLIKLNLKQSLLIKLII